MDMQAIKEEIRLQLTGCVMSLELSDESLTKIINMSFREVQRYIDTVAVITIPYEKCIDLSAYPISAVIGVRRAVGELANNDGKPGSTVMDPLYLTKWQILSRTGNISNVNDYVLNYASWSTIQQIENTTSTDLANYYDKLTQKLYINVNSNLPEKITVIYVPRFDDVSQITSDFWIDVLVRMAVANAKCIVGRVRTKFKQSNALWTMDGDTLLAEGTEELKTLRQELKDSTQLVYGID